MELLLALASGVLYAAGIYLMLRRRLAQLIIGIGLLSNGTNLLIFTAGGLTRGRPPVVPDGDRDRVRSFGLLVGAGASSARHGGHRRCR